MRDNEEAWAGQVDNCLSGFQALLGLEPFVRGGVLLVRTKEEPC